MAHPNPTLPQPSPQGGNAILVVMMGMLLIMGMVGAMVENFSTAEAEAVAESLAKTRIYWAMRGQMDYMLSRARGTAAFSGTTVDDAVRSDPANTTKTVALIGYLGELNALTDGAGQVIATLNSGALRWAYPENGSNYFFDINVADSVRDNNINPTFGDNTGDDGRLVAQFDLRNSVAIDGSTPAPLLNGIENRVASLRVDFCIGNFYYAQRLTPGNTCEFNSPVTPPVDPRVDPIQPGISSIERLSLVRP